MNVKPVQPQSDPKPEQLQNLRQNALTIELIQSLNRVWQPRGEEVAHLILSICRRKRWTRRYLAAIMCVDDLQIRYWERGQKKPPGMAVRLLWLLDTMDVAPEKALSVLHLATWGKIGAQRTRVQHRALEGEEKQKVMDELKACVASGYKLPPKRMTRRQLSERYGIPEWKAKAIAKEAKYAVANANLPTYRQKRIPNILRPESIWMNLDWDQTLAALAVKANCTQRGVTKALQRLRKFHKRTLLRHIRACGQPLKNFDRVINPPDRKRRNKKHIFIDEAGEFRIPSDADEQKNQ